MKKLTNFGLYFITDRNISRKTIFDDAGSALKAGVKIVQYREKEFSTGKMIQEAMKLKKLCKKNKAIFIINDRIDVALAVDADGVHIGDNDMPYEKARKILGKKKIIGISTSSAKQSIKAEKIGADYIGLGPIFSTATKKDAKPAIGIKPIRELRNKLKIPLVAIGGINEANIDEVLKAGARNIAIISSIVAKDDVEKAARFYIKKIKK